MSNENSSELLEKSRRFETNLAVYYVVQILLCLELKNTIIKVLGQSGLYSIF